MKRLLAVDKPPTCAGEWLMPPGREELHPDDRPGDNLERDYDQDERVPCGMCGDHQGERVAWCEQEQIREFRETYGPYGIGGLE